MDRSRSEQSDIEPIHATDNVIASQDTLVLIFERIGSLFKPLEEYAEVPTTETVKDVLVEIMVELLETFAIMTKEIKQGRASELAPNDMFPVVDRVSARFRKNFFKKLIRRESVEEALRRMNRLTKEAIEIMKASGTEEGKSSWLLSLASLVAEIDML